MVGNIIFIQAISVFERFTLELPVEDIDVAFDLFCLLWLFLDKGHLFTDFDRLERLRLRFAELRLRAIVHIVVSHHAEHRVVSIFQSLAFLVIDFGLQFGELDLDLLDLDEFDISIEHAGVFPCSCWDTAGACPVKCDHVVAWSIRQ